MGTITRLKDIQCLGCFKTLDNHGPADKHSNAVPKEGDVSICLHCGAICKYDKDLNLQPINAAELELIRQTDPAIYDELQLTVAVIKAMIKQN